MLGRIVVFTVSLVLFQNIFPIFAAIGDPASSRCLAAISLVYTPRGTNEQTAVRTTFEIPNISNGALIDRGVLKTYWVVNLGKAIRLALTEYQKSYGDLSPALSGDSSTGSTVRFRNIPYIPWTKTEKPEEENRKKRVAAGLSSLVSQFTDSLRDDGIASDAKLDEALVYVGKLAQLMKSNADSYMDRTLGGGAAVYRGGYATRGGGMSRGVGGAASFFLESTPSMESLRVAAGGAQDWNQFKAKLDQGELPSLKDFDLEGFVRSFSLPLAANGRRRSKDLIAGKVGGFYDSQNRKIFLQLDLDGNLTEETFKRPPLNLVVALDVSGSMVQRDGTDISRLKWAQTALLEMLDMLTENDSLSIVLFDHEVSILQEPIIVTAANRSEIRQKITSTTPRGTTDIALALTASIALAEKAKVTSLFGKKGDRETRIVLLTDAGNNTGSSNGTVVQVAGMAAQAGTSLTVIGVGEQLEPELAKQLSLQRGGNYIFVKDGKGIQSLFNRFDLLVTPIGYNLTLNAEIRGVNAVLAQAFGANIEPGQTTLSNIMSIPTLFFVNTESDGGGTLFFEFDVKPESK